MADDRLLHKKLGHSEKVNLLTADEEIAWIAYKLNADDFGVMPFKAVTLQNAHNRLANKATKAVQKMLERIRDVGLIRTFNHQHQSYCYQHDWQTWQKIRYPAETSYPRIPGALLVDCCLHTQWMHTVWPGGQGREGKQLSNWAAPRNWQPPDWLQDGCTTVAEKSCNDPATVADPLHNGCRSVAPRVGARGTHTHTNTSTQGESAERGNSSVAVLSPSTNPELSERAARFLERYAEMHERYLHGARYVGKVHLDHMEALQLVAVYDDARLDKLAIAWFQTGDDFSVSGTRTLAKFRSRASWCDAKLRERGL